MRLTWYIIRLHIGPFLFGTSAVVFIFLLQFIFKYVNDLVGKGLTYGVIGQFILYNLAWMLVLAMPMGVLVATLMAYGKLSGNNELTIIRSSGGSAFRAMRPAIIGGAILSIGLFIFNDRILPEANHKASVLQNDIKQLKPTFAVEPGRFSSVQGYSILARQVDQARGELYNVTIYGQEGDGLNVINAKRAEMVFNHDLSKLLMTLHQGEIQQVNRRNMADFRKLTFVEYRIAVTTSGFNFSRSDPSSFGRTDRTMNIAQMRAIADTATVRSRQAAAQVDSLLRHSIEVPPAPRIDTPRSTPHLGTPHLGIRRIDTPAIHTGRRGSVLTNTPPKNTLPKNTSRDTTRDTARDTTRKDTARNARREAAAAALNDFALIRAQIESAHSMRIEEVKRADQYWVEIHKKYSIPAACLVFVFVGAPLGILVKRGNFGVSASIALGFFIIYWACLVAGEKLADRTLLSPAVAMWMADAVIGAMGTYLTILVSRETVTFDFDFTWIRRLFRSKRKEV